MIFIKKNEIINIWFTLEIAQADVGPNKATTTTTMKKQNKMKTQ